MNWDLMGESQPSGLQKTSLQNKGDKGRPSPIKLSIDWLPRIPKKQSIKYIPVGLENDRKEERKREQEARGGAGKHRKIYNAHRHLQIEDFVFASHIGAEREERQKQFPVRELQHHHSPPSSSWRACADG